MKVWSAFNFTDQELRQVRAAHGRGGRATRKECLTFVDRAIREALRRAPEPKPKRVARPKPVVTPPVDLPDGVKEAETRARLRRLYGLSGGSAGRPVVGGN